MKDAVAAFNDLAKDVPDADLEVKDLENPDVFRPLPADQVQARAAVWTEVKAA